MALRIGSSFVPAPAIARNSLDRRVKLLMSSPSIWTSPVHLVMDRLSRGLRWRASRHGRVGVAAGFLCLSILGCSESGSVDSDGAQASVPPNALVEFLGMAKDEIREFQEAESRLVEERISECMKAEGFDYVPNPLAMDSLDRARQSLSREEFIDSYGYGIDQRLSEPVPDPNEEALARMSAEETASFEDALMGHGPEEPGCATQARRQVAEDRSLSPAALAIADGLREAFDATNADDRVIDSIRDWAACMAGRGWEFNHPSEIPSFLLGLYLPADQYSGLDGEESPEQDDHAGDLSEIRDLELSIAHDDLHCGIEYQRVFAQVLREKQEAYIEAHEGEFLAFREYVQSYSRFADTAPTPNGQP